MNFYSFLIQFFVALCTVALKGFQYKNVQGNHYKLTAVTSFLMAAGDVISIGLIVHNGWLSVIPAGLGATLGIIGSMWIHNKYITKEKL